METMRCPRCLSPYWEKLPSDHDCEVKCKACHRFGTVEEFFVTAQFVELQSKCPRDQQETMLRRLPKAIVGNGSDILLDVDVLELPFTLVSDRTGRIAVDKKHIYLVCQEGTRAIDVDLDGFLDLLINIKGFKVEDASFYVCVDGQVEITLTRPMGFKNRVTVSWNDLREIILEVLGREAASV